MNKLISRTHNYKSVFSRYGCVINIYSYEFCSFPTTFVNSNRNILRHEIRLRLCNPVLVKYHPNHKLFVTCNIVEFGFPRSRKISCIEFQLSRSKSKTTKKRPEYDSDSDSDDDVEHIQGTKVVTLNMQSLRLDGILKKGMAISRSKVDAVFYEGDVRVNGQKPLKKSQQLQIGDEVDIIRGLSPMNSENLHISRLELISVREDADDDEEKLRVKVRRTKSLYVENYPEAPWKKVGVST